MDEASRICHGRGKEVLSVMLFSLVAPFRTESVLYVVVRIQVDVKEVKVVLREGDEDALIDRACV